MLSVECYDLRKVDILFASLDSASRVFSFIRSKAFSPERYLNLQLQRTIHDAIATGESTVIFDAVDFDSLDAPSGDSSAPSLSVRSKVILSDGELLIQRPQEPHEGAMPGADDSRNDPMWELPEVPSEFDGLWRVSFVNEDYLVCESYPRRLLVPAGISDFDLLQAASFRTKVLVTSFLIWYTCSGTRICSK